MADLTHKVAAHRLRAAADFIETHGLACFRREFAASDAEIEVYESFVRPAIEAAGNTTIEGLRQRADEIEGRT